jgi:hypothetical protein
LVGEESVSGVTGELPPVKQGHPLMRIYIIGSDAPANRLRKKWVLLGEPDMAYNGVA